MSELRRGIEKLVTETLNVDGKMAFVPGPRQVGKTTFAKGYGSRFSQSSYFNWDSITDQKKLLKDPYFFEKLDRDPRSTPLIIFDEIHKYARLEELSQRRLRFFQGRISVSRDRERAPGLVQEGRGQSRRTVHERSSLPVEPRGGCWATAILL